jgi:WD40 repeat protein
MRGFIHTAQARGFAPLADGTFVTSGWDGRVLRWPGEFGSARLVGEFDGRAPEICVHPDRSRAYVGVPKGVLVVPVEGDPHAIVLGKDEDVEAIACDGELLVVGTDKNRVVAFSTADHDEVWSTKLGDPAALCFRADGTLLVGDEHGTLRGIDRSGQIVWTRREHRDLVDKLPHGNPHCNVFALAASPTSWVSACNDDSVRLFDGETRRRRFLVDGGIFNGIAFSPDGTRLAFAGSHEFCLFDATHGEHLLTVPVSEFPGADELTRPCFAGDGRILVGAENGAIFEVALT